MLKNNHSNSNMTKFKKTLIINYHPIKPLFSMITINKRLNNSLENRTKSPTSIATQKSYSHVLKTKEFVKIKMKV